jgi:glycosyltransferase involved in cell wall biosynthesis
VIALSVIICAHNPRPVYLRRVLDALRGQTLPLDQWELLLIDNASSEALAGRFDLSWHPRARVIREDELGMASARIRAIVEFRADLAVFVDDDNVLDPDYLAAALETARQRPYIGVWGGSSRGEYEIEPPASIAGYLGPAIAVSEIDRDYWANLDGPNDSTPFGAGMCVRRVVAEAYAAKFRRDPLRQRLGRRGGKIGGGEDIDLAYTAIELNLGTGRFHRLKFTHLIPKTRITEDYVVWLHTGFAVVEEISCALYHRRRPFRNPWIARLRYLYLYLRGNSLDRRVLRAGRRAEKETRELIARIQREQKEAPPEEASRS